MNPGCLLRQAYRKLARRHHPDKDPGGREKFHAIQAAYERLQAGVGGGQGTRPARIQLLLKVGARDESALAREYRV